MAMVTMKSPVPTCLAAASFTVGMMRKHGSNHPALLEMAQPLASVRGELAGAERALDDANEALLVARIDVRYEDHASDEWLAVLQRHAQIADGHKGGRLNTTLFPDGLNDITRRQGASQVKRMRDLQSRLEQITGWPEAPAQLATLIARRTSYEQAIEARTEAERRQSDARVARDAAKVRFLDVYAEVAARIQAEFPRNKRMQEQFFDTIYTSRRARAGAPDETLPGEPDGEGDAG
jgi:hypothetical protein